MTPIDPRTKRRRVARTRVRHGVVAAALAGFLVPAMAQEADLVWWEDDSAGTGIYHSAYRQGRWGPRTTVFADDRFNILPAIASDSAGRRLAVWAVVEGDGDGATLRYAFQSADAWETPQPLLSPFQWNLAPAIAFDEANVPHVFWSANNGDDDDIYFAAWEDGAWTPPRLVHDDNTIPDIQPQAGLDAGNGLWVSWQALEDGRYVERIRYRQDGAWTEGPGIAATASGGPEASEPIDLPEFFFSRGVSTLHLPGARQHRSIPVPGRESRDAPDRIRRIAVPGTRGPGYFRWDDHGPDRNTREGGR